MRRLPVLLLAGVLVMSALPVFSQSDEDAEAVVLDALERLNETSYHFVLEDNTYAKLSNLGDGYFWVYGDDVYEGDMTANGDQQIKFDSLLAGMRSRFSFSVERIQVGGVVYLNVTDASVFGSPIDLEPGWIRLDAMMAEDASGAEVLLRSRATRTVPTVQEHVSFFDTYNELEPEQVNGIEMCVFEVELNARALQFSMMPGSFVERVESWARDRAAYAAGELTATYRLWIGADDGQLYRAELDSLTNIPYLTYNVTINLVHDLELQRYIKFEITDHDTAVEVEAPI